MNTFRRIAKNSPAILLAPLIALSPGMATIAIVSTATIAISVSTAEAQLGTARRTTRRTARRVVRRTGRRLAVLPPGAAPVIIGGATYYYAQNTYWEPVNSGGGVTYVEVIVEG